MAEGYNSQSVWVMRGLFLSPLVSGEPGDCTGECSAPFPFVHNRMPAALGSARESLRLWRVHCKRHPAFGVCAGDAVLGVSTTEASVLSEVCTLGESMDMGMSFTGVPPGAESFLPLPSSGRGLQ
jgi:hypothetical protein